MECIFITYLFDVVEVNMFLYKTHKVGWPPYYYVYMHGVLASTQHLLYVRTVWPVCPVSCDNASRSRRSLSDRSLWLSSMHLLATWMQCCLLFCPVLNIVVFFSARARLSLLVPFYYMPMLASTDMHDDKSHHDYSIRTWLFNNNII